MGFSLTTSAPKKCYLILITRRFARNLIVEKRFTLEEGGLQEFRLYTWGLDMSGSMQGAGGVCGLLAIERLSGFGQASPSIQSYYPTYDGNGNVSEYLDAQGVTVAHFEYDPFGNNTVDTDSVGLFDIRFSTKKRDSSTGLYYYGYRYYDPVTGRWPSRDPIEERGGINLYGMIGNNCIMGWDVLGLESGCERGFCCEDDRCQPCDEDGEEFSEYHDCPGCGAPLFGEGGVVFVGGFKWHGNWGGPGRVNGQTGRWQETDWDYPIKGQPGFVAPVDKRDECYYRHDVALRNCGRIEDPAERKKCRRKADVDLGQCLYAHGALLSLFLPTAGKGAALMAEGLLFMQPLSPNNNEGAYTPPE